ncbi:MAG: hypothetical protein ABSD88_12195, partial [Candidatus Korobacteraceae bacterium]
MIAAGQGSTIAANKHLNSASGRVPMQRISSRQTKQRLLPWRLGHAAVLLAAALLVLSVASPRASAAAAFAENPGASAQSSGGTETPDKPSQPEKHSKKPANDKKSKKPAKKSPDDNLPFAKVMREVGKRGTPSQVPSYIAQELRLVDVNSQLYANEITDSERVRVIYLVNQSGSNTALLLTKVGEQPTVYVTNRAGVLKQAARITTGRMQSKTLRDIPLPAAQAG